MLFLTCNIKLFSLLLVLTELKQEARPRFPHKHAGALFFSELKLQTQQHIHGL